MSELPPAATRSKVGRSRSCRCLGGGSFVRADSGLSSCGRGAVQTPGVTRAPLPLRDRSPLCGVGLGWELLISHAAAADAPACPLPPLCPSPSPPTPARLPLSVQSSGRNKWSLSTAHVFENSVPFFGLWFPAGRRDSESSYDSFLSYYTGGLFSLCLLFIFYFLFF